MPDDSSDAIASSIGRDAYRDAYCVVGSDGSVLGGDEALCALLGCRPQDLPGLQLAQLEAVESPGAVRRQLQRALELGHARHETRWRTTDGRLISVELTAARIAADRVALHVRDTTAHQKAISELRASGEGYRAVFEHALDPMFSLDSERNVRDANFAAESLLGVMLPDLLGRSFDTFLVPGDDERFAAEWQRFLDIGEARGALTLLRSGGERRETEYSARAHYLLGRHLLVLRDHTERGALERRLAHAEKLEAVGRLAAGVAHDFNNLLMVILGAADMAMARASRDAELRRDMDDIRDATLRAAALTRRLLAFGREQRFQLRHVELNEVLTESERMLRRLLGTEVGFTFRGGSGLWRISAERVQLDQVVLNLVINARDAMPNGGQLTIETRNVTRGPSPDDFPADLPVGDYVLLTVTDTGHGMTDEVKRHLFEPFFTTKERGKGTGLGLASVYGIVRQFEGYIWAESSAGSGTSFHLAFPRARSDADAETNPPPRAVPGAATVLVAEDEETLRRLVARTLRDAGFDVLVAVDGHEALMLAASYPHDIDVLLTDVVMPRLGARELVQRLRAERPGIRVVLMSAYVDAGAFPASNDFTALPLLTKPFTPAALLSTLTEVLRAPA